MNKIDHQNPICGFGIRNFRSFGDVTQFLGPFSKINIFIGENNSGKSNILRYINKVYAPLSQRSSIKLDAKHDVHTKGNLVRLPILFPISSSILESKFNNPRINYDQFNCLLQRLSVHSAPEGFAWFNFNPENSQIDLSDALSDKADEYRDAHPIWSALQNASGGGKEHWLPSILQQVSQKFLPRVTPTIIPTLRRLPTRLQAYEQEYGGLSDSTPNIIEELAAIESPTYDRMRDRARFDAIQDFIRRVLKRSDITLQIPHDRKTITVYEYGRYIPIEALGTGIHQLLVLASKAILEENSVVCIEEPELHLHPELQHQIMHFLSEHTSNQYFITTHSASIMDAVKSQVYSTRIENNDSVIDTPLTKNARRQVCHILGYRPSDLLQANSLIWVEGPSDRIYLLNWLNAEAKELQEGWHFSIMFYGGRLLSNLTGEDRAVDEFIALMPINRFPAILIDSDKRFAQGRINESKKRVNGEFGSDGRFSWITKGKEIENYVRRNERLKAIRSIYGEQCELASNDDVYGHPLEFRKNETLVEKVDKLAIARAVCEHPLDLNVLDLKGKICELITYIKMANHLT